MYSTTIPLYAIEEVIHIICININKSINSFLMTFYGVYMMLIESTLRLFAPNNYVNQKWTT